MQLLPIKTNILKPPQDDLLTSLSAALPKLEEQDILIISSKVVAIHEGRCVPVNEVDKQVLVKNEAELVIPREYWGTPLTVIHHAFIGAAGIDESNADGHYILLPADPFKSAQMLHQYLKVQFGLREVGVVIVDSHSVPMRYGATGIAIGFWGFAPLKSHIGEQDLFGREFRIERSNIADGLAAGASLVMGETNEQTPVVIAREVPNLTFSDTNEKDTLFAPFADDTFRVLYERWLTDDGQNPPTGT